MRVSDIDLILATNGDPIASVVYTLSVLSVLVDDRSVRDQVAWNIKLEHHAHVVGSIEVLSNLVADEEFLADRDVSAIDGDRRVVRLVALDLDFCLGDVSLGRSEVDIRFTRDKVGLSAVCSNESGTEGNRIVTIIGTVGVEFDRCQAVLHFIRIRDESTNVCIVVFLFLDGNPVCFDLIFKNSGDSSVLYFEWSIKLELLNFGLVWLIDSGNASNGGLGAGKLIILVTHLVLDPLNDLRVRLEEISWELGDKVEAKVNQWLILSDVLNLVASLESHEALSLSGFIKG